MCIPIACQISWANVIIYLNFICLQILSTDTTMVNAMFIAQRLWWLLKFWSIPIIRTVSLHLAHFCTMNGKDTLCSQQVNLQKKTKARENQCACHVTLQNWKISLIFTYDTCLSATFFVFVLFQATLICACAVYAYT